MPSTDITAKSHELFMDLARDAGSWSGTPLVEVTPAERGNLTQLKRAGLLRTFLDEDQNAFACFTLAGVKLAGESGEDLSWIPEAWLA